MAKKQSSKSTNGKQESSGKRIPGKDLPIEYVFPDDQRAIFSNYATVQREGSSFHLSFFEIRPPLLMGSEEERRKILDSLESVRAHCLARIVVSVERAGGLVTALLDQLEKSKKEPEEPKKTDSSTSSAKKATTDSQHDSKKKR